MKGLLPIAMLLMGALGAQAHTHVYQAILAGANENIPNASTAFGTSTVTLDLDLITLRVELSFSGLAGNSVEANLFGPTTTALLGVGGPIMPVFSSTGFPTGATSGIYDHEFSVGFDADYHPDFLASSGGTAFFALQALDSALDEGKAYISIRSSAFPDGEIRGFLVIPEPTVLALLGSACVFMIRRRKSASREPLALTASVFPKNSGHET